MSNIVRRTVLMSRNNDKAIRLHDWAIVTMDNGMSFAEPFFFGQRLVPGKGFVDTNFSDQMARVDDMLWIDPMMESWRLSGGDARLHGGPMLPKLSVAGNTAA